MVLWTVWSSEWQLISFKYIFWSFHNYILIPSEVTEVLLIRAIKKKIIECFWGTEAYLKLGKVILYNFHVKTTGENVYIGTSGGAEGNDGWNDGKIFCWSPGPTTYLPEVIYIKVPHFIVYVDMWGPVCVLFLCSKLGRLPHFHWQIYCLKLVHTNCNTIMYVNVD